jgi:hypothetical protein
VKVPPQLYAIGLVELMRQKDVLHFEVDLKEIDAAAERDRGLSIDFELDEATGKLIISTGRCDCANCRAKTGGTQ